MLTNVEWIKIFQTPDFLMNLFVFIIGGVLNFFKWFTPDIGKYETKLVENKTGLLDKLSLKHCEIFKQFLSNSSPYAPIELLDGRDGTENGAIREYNEDSYYVFSKLLFIKSCIQEMKDCKDNLFFIGALSLIFMIIAFILAIFISDNVVKSVILLIFPIVIIILQIYFLNKMRKLAGMIDLYENK